MSENLERSESKELARPLKVLVPLIQQDIAAAKQAAEEASTEHFCNAGDKMIEAKLQMSQKEFGPWVKLHFNRSLRQAYEWINLAEERKQGRTYATVRESVQKTRKNPNYGKGASYHKPVREELRDVDVRTLNLRKAALEREKEREAERKLAIQLINIGYKVLATKLHPDRGGSEVAMTRLNHVRDKLRKHA